MKVTPLDLRQAQFKTKMRGYDPQEVGPFLADAANELEQALREIDRLRQDLVRSETAMTEHRDRETSLRNTLLTAQRLADSIKENAENEARTLIREAETRADHAAAEGAGPPHGGGARHQRDEAAPPRRRRLARSVDRVADLRARFHAGQDQAERDEKLLLHRPKAVDLLAAAGPQGVRPRPGRPGGQPHGPQPVNGPQAITGPQAVPSIRPAEPRLVAQNSDARPQVAEKAG